LYGCLVRAHCNGTTFKALGSKGYYEMQVFRIFPDSKCCF
jgi:hypothetical protein